MRHLGFPIASAEARMRHLDWLRDNEHRFRTEANPFFAWAAILNAQAAQVSLPAFVIDYLTDAAAHFVRGHEPIARARRPQWIAEILGLKPKGAGRKRDAFDRASAPLPGMVLAWDYGIARMFQGCTHEKALHQVAQTNLVSESSVKQAWTRYRPHLSTLGVEWACATESWPTPRNSPDSLS
jgi:hypothetical protein